MPIKSFEQVLSEQTVRKQQQTEQVQARREELDYFAQIEQRRQAEQAARDHEQLEQKRGLCPEDVRPDSLQGQDHPNPLPGLGECRGSNVLLSGRLRPDGAIVCPQVNRDERPVIFKVAGLFLVDRRDSSDHPP